MLLFWVLCIVYVLVQKSLGVNRKFQVLKSTVNTILKPDIAKSALPLIGPLLEHTAGASPSLQVVFYTGIFDFDCNIVGHLAWLSQVEWSGKAALAAVNRTVFQVLFSASPFSVTVVTCCG